MTLVLAMPSHRRGQKLWPSFDEDDVTLAWQAVRGLKRGTAVRTEGLALPDWFWAGTGLKPDPAATTSLRLVGTTVGGAIALLDGPFLEPDVEAAARQRFAQAPTRTEADWQKHRVAREAPDAEADFPLGAYVLGPRHDAVLTRRLQMPPGKVLSWTTIGAGAAPSEFIRLQDAVGAYHVVLVDCGGERTVGLWAGDAQPRTGQTVQPVLRRLFRTQGAWRYGVKFAPEGAAPPRAPPAGPPRADPPHFA
ncbi:MAG TPA: hypothetical protein VM327_05360 [Candidatus Thermoplasmatota archaeon]|nr:hypothetical protein [Candidatus Thermoplasmatota archaeon]